MPRVLLHLALPCWIIMSLLLSNIVLGPLAAGEETESPSTQDTPAAVRTIIQAAYNQALDSVAPAKTSAVEISAAEHLTRLKKSLQTDAERLAELRRELANPQSEYRLAEEDFKKRDQELQRAQDQLAMTETLDPAQRELLQQRIQELTKKHQLARARFDLAIQTRKTLQEQIAALEVKQQQEQQALDRQANTAPPAATGTAMPALAPAAPSVPGLLPEEATKTAPATVNPAANRAAVPAAGGTDVKTSPAPLLKPKAPSKELVAAENEAHQKKAVALSAERDAQSIAERIAALDKDLELENKLLAATRKKADLAYQTARTLDEDLEKRQQAGAPAAEINELQTQRRDAEKLLRTARAEVDERVDRLTELQTERADLQREELAFLNAAKSKQTEAQAAEDKVSRLKNPFALQNILQWLLDHAPKIGIILLGMFLLRRMLTLTNQRVTRLMVMRSARGTEQEREDRARTLAGVFHNAVSLLIVVSGVLMICEEIGISVGPLMGGAAVVGLAVAFGAQNLIRDYFYGFVILSENQYKLNDILKIGDISGQVEQITLRMTVLRDLEGNVHFIPNGKIDSVTNMTHGWSRAVLDVGIAYGEDVDRVMMLLLEITNELRADPEFYPQIIDDPEMLGVDQLGDSAVTIKLMVKTRPLCQWKVKRELLRRIKRRFDELGIEIPFPQRVVTHRYEEDNPAPPQTKAEPKPRPIFEATDGDAL